MKTVHDWLNATYLNATMPKGLERERLCVPIGQVIKNVHVFAALVDMNRGFLVTGWGVTTSGGLYGQHGLEMHAALDLLGMSAYITGLLDAHGESPDALVPIINAEHTRVLEAKTKSLSLVKLQ